MIAEWLKKVLKNADLKDSYFYVTENASKM